LPITIAAVARVMAHPQLTVPELTDEIIRRMVEFLAFFTPHDKSEEIKLCNLFRLLSNLLRLPHQRREFTCATFQSLKQFIVLFSEQFFDQQTDFMLQVMSPAVVCAAKNWYGRADAIDFVKWLLDREMPLCLGGDRCRIAAAWPRRPAYATRS
jgi:hypothetical protein